MPRPITPTPYLKGKDAVAFTKSMRNPPPPVSREEYESAMKTYTTVNSNTMSYYNKNLDNPKHVNIPSIRVLEYKDFPK